MSNYKRKWKPTKKNLEKWERERAAKLEPLSFEWLEYHGNCPHMFGKAGVCDKCGVGSLVIERKAIRRG